MTRLELIERLIAMLLEGMPEYGGWAARAGDDERSRRALLRGLMNLRPPAPLSDGFIRLQDELLGAERDERGIVDAMALPTIAGEGGRMALWQGDITRLSADAIVNAANAGLLGCFHPGHACIDNVIHSAAGLRLREECAASMRRQEHPEPTGSVKVTGAYNLPSRYVFHTVGPIVAGELSRRHRDDLRNCYTSCLEAASERGLSSIAFCCVSTGEYRFPPREAAAIALRTVREFLRSDAVIARVVMNVFKDSDRAIYEDLLEAP